MKNLILLNFGLLLILVGSANSKCCDRCGVSHHCHDGTHCDNAISCCATGPCNIFCCHCSGHCRNGRSSSEDQMDSINRVDLIING